MANISAVKAPTENIIEPKLSLKDISNGEEFKVIRSTIDIMIRNKTDKHALHHACMELARSLKLAFGMETTIAIVSPEDSVNFYGYNVFPSIPAVKAIINKVDDPEDFKNIREIWKRCKWHIDIDGAMLYDPSNRLNSAEMATLLLYCIEQVVFDYDTPIRIAYNIKQFETEMRPIDRYIAKSSRLRDIFIIPFMVGCATTSFVYADPARVEALKLNSIIASNEESFARYQRAVEKIVFRYGRGELVDQSQFMMDKKLRYILIWVYEGLNDLRHSSMRLIENIRRYMTACRSPYVRLVFKNMLVHFLATQPNTTNMQGPTVGTPGGFTQPVYSLEEGYINPELEQAINKQHDDYWKEYVATVESKYAGEFIDKNGYFKKVSREDLDMIMVEAEAIESVDDKVYLLEKLYKEISAIDAAIDMLDSKDAKNQKKVKQTKNELLLLKEYASDVRMRIMRVKLQPPRYGLYIKYPGGYEG